MFYSCKNYEVDMASLFPDTKDYSEIFKKNPIPEHSVEQILNKLEE